MLYKQMDDDMGNESQIETGKNSYNLKKMPSIIFRLKILKSV